MNTTAVEAESLQHPAIAITDTEITDAKKPVAVCHGRKWYDCNLSTKVAEPIPQRQWFAINKFGERVFPGSSLGRNMTRMEYFLMLFPPEQLTILVQLTNAQLRKKKETETTTGEMVRFLGVTILMTWYRFSDRSTLWDVTSDSTYIQAADLGRTGISRERFEVLWANQRWSDQPEKRPRNMSHSAYRWLLVSGHILRFNRWRETNFSPSEWIGVDRSFSRWFGLAEASTDRCFHTDRDLDPGLLEDGVSEIHNSCCGKSGVMLHLKIADPAQHEKTKDNDNGLPHRTIVMKELLRPWLGTETKRIVCAESYFSSARALVELNQLGMKFIGVVNSQEQEYPLTHLSNIQLGQDGDTKSLISYSDEGRPEMLAFVWRDHHRRQLRFICNGENLDPGIPIYRTQWSQQPSNVTDTDGECVDLEIFRPKACELYQSVCDKVERDGLPQNEIIDIGKIIGTSCWHIRLNFAIFSVVVGDVYSVYKECSGEAETPDFFYSSLAEELIKNTFDYSGTKKKGKTPPIPKRTGEGILAPFLIPTKRKKRKRDGTPTNYVEQGKCRVCSKHTSWVCAMCDKLEPDARITWHCHEKNGRACFNQHLASKHPDWL